MNYLVTGATGFIGRFVVAELLKQPDAKIYAIVRQGSASKLDAIRNQLQAGPEKLVLITGDLTAPRLGISSSDIAALKGGIDHFFHLAAIYDLNAPAEPQQKANVEGTRHALQAAEDIAARCFHHVSSIAVAGIYSGLFTEKMFEEATGLVDPYFVTKHLAEACVRNESTIPFRIYRPSMVVGHSQTGEIDKIDGLYYILQVLELIGRFWPRWIPLIGLEGGQFNVVPVDYVVKAMLHIAHLPSVEGNCFHLTSPVHYRLGELLNLVAAQSETLPRFIGHIPNTLINLLPANTIPGLAKLGWVQYLFRKIDVAPGVLTYATCPTTFDCTQTLAALAGSGIEPPLLQDYLPTLWQYWCSHLSPYRSENKNFQFQPE